MLFETRKSWKKSEVIFNVRGGRAPPILSRLTQQRGGLLEKSPYDQKDLLTNWMGTQDFHRDDTASYPKPLILLAGSALPLLSSKRNPVLGR